jgi:hypothetical protein
MIKQSLNKALSSAWLIIKFVVPIYLLADILFYYDLLSNISFLFEPVTRLINLPPEAALALISGMTLNLYAGIAFAAPLDMSVAQWSILAVYLGIAHSLVVESAVMKQIGLEHRYSYGIRIAMAVAVASIMGALPAEWIGDDIVTARASDALAYSSIWDLLGHSAWNASILTLKIVLLITILIFAMDWLKSSTLFRANSSRLSKGMTLVSGLVLGITYGAGVLIAEAKSGDMSKDEIFVIGSFLLICHALIEDTLLFAMMGANGWVVVIVRGLSGVLVALGAYWWVGKIKNKN